VHKKYISRLLNGVFILIITLFVLDGLTPIEIKNQSIKSFAYFGMLICSPLILFWNLFTSKTIKKKISTSVIPGIALIGILAIGPMKIIFSASVWSTQTVLYQHKHKSNKKIEFQMQDVGALGYNRRNVEVLYLTSFFLIANPVEKNVDKRIDWIKVDKDVNELELKPL